MQSQSQLQNVHFRSANIKSQNIEYDQAFSSILLYNNFLFFVKVINPVSWNDK